MSDDFDNVRLGVVRDTMKSNPLLVKASLGHPKPPSVDDSRVFGIATKKLDGGTAAALGAGRTATPPINAETQRALAQNPLLSKPDVGRPRQPISQGVEDIVHGISAKKGMAVSDSINWQDLGPNPYSKQPEVGRARPPISKEAETRVHGITAKHKDGGTAEVLSKWNAPEDHTVKTTSPLLAKSEVGRPRGVDQRVAAKVHGKKSRDPKIEGGVTGAMSDWSRPDTQEHNARARQPQTYKPELGRARPPISTGIEQRVHGKKNVKRDGGTSEALGDWKPSTPTSRRRPRGALPEGVTFGKPSGKPESLSALMTNSYGKQWLKDQMSGGQGQGQAPQPQRAPFAKD
eukprot:m.7959 g.7959  ORF g.7959 m.7959 type:complete len:346 (-) comp5303_c0_seq1:493-1530(-)